MKIDEPKGAGKVSIGWGSDAVAEMLNRIGLEFVALNPGASFRGLHDSIVNYLGNKNPQILLTLHEEHAVSIAQGYAKVKEKPMGAIVHSNVGLMHATMSIFNAWCDRAPVIIFGATGPVDAARRRPWIDWIHTARDQGALIRDYTKWDDQPGSVSAALESVLRANVISQTPPRGPVYVCLDVALQEDEIGGEIPFQDVSRFMPGRSQEVSREGLKAAAELLLKAKNPVILMGRTSRGKGAWNRRVKFAEALGAKVLTDMKVPAAFPSKHPLHAALPGLFLSKEGADLIRGSDVILSLDWVDLGGTLKTVWGEGEFDAKVIHCSVDQHNHKGWSMDYFGLPPVDVGIFAEPDTVISTLLDAVQDMKGAGVAGILPEDEKEDFTPLKPVAEQAPEETSGPVTLRSLAIYLKRAIGEKSVCITRVPIGWPGDILEFKDPLDYLGKEGGGGVGAGPGVSVGAALALRDSGRLPIAVLGDGDCLMGVTAFWTAARYRIPLLVIVANNRSFGNSQNHQRRVAGHRHRPEENQWIGTRIDDPSVDIGSMARAQGMKAEGPITDLKDLPGALERAIKVVEKGEGIILDVLTK
ncbi:MAG: thiamine pyrophosphate-dependent enzyme [Pseudomonadota bacterium]